jgi:signal transduction histidine kinase
MAPDETAADRWWPADLDEPQARFMPHGTLEMVSPLIAMKAPQAGSVPLLDVAVPLRRGTTALGVARYWIDGDAVADEFGRLDRRLAGQAAAAFVGAAVLAALVLWLAFTRLAEANRRLLEQSADLARANAELDFAAKTGALGAISAHLIHGLKNPLAGLEGFVADTAVTDTGAARGDAGRLAMETTRRLRALVNEVTTVLRDESGDAPNYTVPIAELVEAARARALALAESVQVAITTSAEADVSVDARTANLTGLVLANLLTNAIEASRPRSTVAVAAGSSGENVEFIVRDAASGLPEPVRAALFRPVRSSKRGGGGMGLAISLRLAKHAGGDLQLVQSDAHGTVFRLVVPGARRP